MEINHICIVHASRNRIERGLKAALDIVQNMTTDMNFTYIWSLDEDDPALPEYEEKIPTLPFPCKVIKGMSRGAVDAMNRGATLATDEDLIMIWTDDMCCPKGWDKSLRDVASNITDEVYYIHVNNLQNSANCAILPLLSMAFYKKLGHIFFKGYISMFCDDELIMIARRMNIIHETQIEGFSHEHMAWGKAPPDDTYARQNKPENYAQGRAVLYQRMASSFDGMFDAPLDPYICIAASDPKGIYANPPLHLPDTTLVCADTTYYRGTMDALHWNLLQCKFGKAILFTDDEFDKKGFSRDKIADMGLEVVKIPKLAGKVGHWSYSYFMLKELGKYVETPYILVTQADGWILNPDAWEDEFKNYDYIGSKWWWIEGENSIGNGGFSFRSKKLHDILVKETEIDGLADAEDFAICGRFKPLLREKHGMTWATIDVANRFAYDAKPSPGKTFGFHQVDTKGYENDFANRYGRF